MDVEQPSLGSVGAEACSVILQYDWETGWRARTASRLSGSETFVERAYSGRDEAELHGVLSDWLADVLGLL